MSRNDQKKQSPRSSRIEKSAYNTGKSPNKQPLKEQNDIKNSNGQSSLKKRKLQEYQQSSTEEAEQQQLAQPDNTQYLDPNQLYPTSNAGGKQNKRQKPNPSKSPNKQSKHDLPAHLNSVNEAMEAAEALCSQQPQTYQGRKFNHICEIRDLSDSSFEGRERVLMENKSFGGVVPSQFRPAEILEDTIVADQNIFIRHQPNGMTRLIWCIHNLNQHVTDPLRAVTSGVFSIIDGSTWYLQFKPKTLIDYDKDSRSVITFNAVPTAGELKSKLGMRRRLYYDCCVPRQDGTFVSFKNFKNIWNFTDQEPSHSQGYMIIKYDPNVLRHKMDKMICISINFLPEAYYDEQENAMSQVSSKRKSSQSARRSQLHHREYNGLVNEGTTCYLNSLFQTLFIIREFRRAIYSLPTDVEDFKSIPFCLQRIFYNLQTGKCAVRTIELLNAFGWTAREMNQQHDINEFLLTLSDTLENIMKNTEHNGLYAELFQGQLENVYQCTEVNYIKANLQTFNCLQLPLENCSSIEESFRKYVEAELLSGDNKYETDKFGKQDARTYIRFKKLPSVLQLSLNRFSFDYQRMEPTKINDKMRFEEVLDLDAVLPQETNLSQQQQAHTGFSQQNGVKNVYHLHAILVHRGGLGAGHYYAYIRPDLGEQWYEFNDSQVTPVARSTAFSVGSGGSETYFEFGGKEQGRLTERLRGNKDSSAYMLIYIRAQDRDRIMKRIEVEEIPQMLKERFDEENNITERLNRDQYQLSNCGPVFIISQETLQGWDQDSICQISSDIYQGPPFRENDEQRLEIQMNRKCKIVDLLTLIRRKTKYPTQDIVIYKINQNDKGGFTFSLIGNKDHTSQNKEVHPKNNRISFYYICHQRGLPILYRMTSEQKQARIQRYTKMINFIERRDLREDFVKTYKKKMKEVWRFVGTEGAMDEDSLLEDDEEEDGEEVIDIQDNSAQPEDPTQDLPVANGGDPEIQFANTLPLETENKVDTDGDNPMAAELSHQNGQNLEQQAAVVETNKKLIFIKIFDEKQHKIEILGNLLINFDTNFNDVISQAIQQFGLVQRIQEYALYVEFPCFYRENNGVINEDENAQVQRIAPTPNNEHKVEIFFDGTIFVLAKDSPQVQEQLNSLINDKKNEVWPVLIEQCEGQNKENHGKVKFNYSMMTEDVVASISKYLLQKSGRVVDTNKIQLYINGDNLTTYGDNVELNKHIYYNEIVFEVQPYTLQQLQENLVVKAQHYFSNNTIGELYVELIPVDQTVWHFIKLLYKTYLYKLEPDIQVKQYNLIVLDKSSKVILKLADPSDKLLKFNQEIYGKHPVSFRISANSLEDQEILTTSKDTCIAYCLTVDQYSQRVGEPFFFPIERTWTIGLIKDTLVSKLQNFKIEYNAYRESYNRKEMIEVTQEQIQQGELNYLEYKTTRRDVNYFSYSLQTNSDEDNESLPNIKKGEYKLNLAYMMWLTYKEDNNYGRSNQLKINNGSNNLQINNNNSNNAFGGTGGVGGTTPNNQQDEQGKNGDADADDGMMQIVT